MPDSPVLDRMQAQIDRWRQQSDQRYLFLSCYQMMSRNMLAAFGQGEFLDDAWVDRLLERFAEYYFAALEAYERDPAGAPAVWQLAFNLTRASHLTALQKMILGVNAHINYDLALALVDLLRPEWASLGAEQRAGRYADHCSVNRVIGQTVDAVQDQLLEPVEPVLRLVDVLFGRLDEQMIAGLIARWREHTWHSALLLLESPDAPAQAALTARLEAEALRMADAITLKDWLGALRELI